MTYKLELTQDDVTKLIALLARCFRDGSIDEAYFRDISDKIITALQKERAEFEDSVWERQK